MPIKINDHLSAICQLQEEGIFTMTEPRDNAAYSSAEGVRAEPDAVKEADGDSTAAPFGQFSAADRG